MFERFTEKAIKVIMLAQEEARRLGHNFVGTEQILLGLIGEGTGIAAKTLKSMGINLKDARVEVEKIIGHDVGGVCPFGINEGIEVYLDESLKKYDYIYPACGTSNSAIKLTVEELYNISNATEFIDVCKVIE